jgi:hypothetical protein
MEARIKTFLKQLENGNIANKSVAVLKLIRDTPKISTDALRDVSGFPHQTLTAIVSNLLDDGVIQVCGEVEVGDSNYSKYIFVEDVDTILGNQRKRRLVKYKYWLKRGAEEFDMFLTERSRNSINLMIEKLNSINLPEAEVAPEDVSIDFDDVGQGYLKF